MRKLTILFIALTLSAGLWAQSAGNQFVDETSGLKFEITAVGETNTVKVISNDYAGTSYTVPATVSYLEDDYAVTAIGENAFAGVGTAAAPADLLLPADWEGTKPAATATLWYGGYFVDYRAAAIAAIREEINDAEQAIENAAVGFEDDGDVKNAKANAASALAYIKATADNTIGAAADMIAIANAKDNAHMATNEALVAIQAAIAGYKERMKNNINDIAMNAKNTIHEYAVADQVKDQAINEIDKAVAEAEESINNADSEDDVKKAINDAQNKINQQLAYVQDYYNKLRAAKADVLAAIDKAVDDAEAAINEAADGYDFVEAIQEIITGAKADFEAVKSEASNIISKKNNLIEVKEKEEEFIHEIEDIQVEAVENIQTEIQPYTYLKENAIAEINAAIDGFTDTEVRAIADKAKTDISNATSEEQINSIKTFAISKIDAIAEINAAIDGFTDTKVRAIADKAKTDISSATSEEQINSIKTFAISKIDAIAKILSDSQGINNTEVNNWIDAAINDIKSGNQNATPSIDEIKDQILYIINLFQNGKTEGLKEGKAAGKAEAFGTMGEKRNGPAVIVTDQDDKQIILYSPKKVQYIKVSDK